MNLNIYLFNPFLTSANIILLIWLLTGSNESFGANIIEIGQANLKGTTDNVCVWIITLNTT